MTVLLERIVTGYISGKAPAFGVVLAGQPFFDVFAHTLMVFFVRPIRAELTRVLTCCTQRFECQREASFPTGNLGSLAPAERLLLDRDMS